MNISIILAMATASILSITTTALAQGPLTPPGAPAPTMKTLQELWDKIGTLETTLTNQQQQLSQSANLLNALAEANGVLGWEITNVTGTNKVGNYNTSLAFTPGGQPAISYTSASGRLNYAAFNGSSWEVSEVTGTNNTGLTSSLAFTPGGQPAISYYSATGGQGLKYAVFNGTAWTLRNVETGNVGSYNSLVFTPGGQPAISYYSAASADLKYAVFNGSTWTITTVDSAGDVGQSPSLAFTPGGQPAISYYNTAGVIKYAVFNGSAWTITSLPYSDLRRVSSLAFTPGGQPIISFSIAGSALVTDGPGLRLAVFNGTTWAFYIVDSKEDVGGDLSMVFTPGGQPAISYQDFNAQDGPNSALKYAVFNGGDWKLCTVAGLSDAGGRNSLAFTPGGQPAISYIDLDNDVLMFAVRKAFTPR